MGQSRALDQRIADRARHHDCPARLPRQRDERIDVELGDGPGLAEILLRSSHGSEPHVAPRRFKSARAGGLVRLASEHLADHGAPLVADQLKHVADLKVAKALHQPRKREHADNDQDSDEKHREQRDLC